MAAPALQRPPLSQIEYGGSQVTPSMSADCGGAAGPLALLGDSEPVLPEAETESTMPVESVLDPSVVVARPRCASEAPLLTSPAPRSPATPATAKATLRENCTALELFMSQRRQEHALHGVTVSRMVLLAEWRMLPAETREAFEADARAKRASCAIGNADRTADALRRQQLTLPPPLPPTRSATAVTSRSRTIRAARAATGATSSQSAPARARVIVELGDAAGADASAEGEDTRVVREVDTPAGKKPRLQKQPLVPIAQVPRLVFPCLRVAAPLVDAASEREKERQRAERLRAIQVRHRDAQKAVASSYGVDLAEVSASLNAPRLSCDWKHEADPFADEGDDAARAEKDCKDELEVDLPADAMASGFRGMLEQDLQHQISVARMRGLMQHKLARGDSGGERRSGVGDREHAKANVANNATAPSS